MNEPLPGAPVIGGRYVLHDEIAHGGMATVHLGRLVGPVGFARTVAIKRLHPHVARDAEFVRAFIDEAHLAARVRHPSVVPVLDVQREGNELFLILEYVVGESLWQLTQSARALGESVPDDVAASVMIGVLHGLHAAHQAVSERGEPLGIVHRDVSPQNVIVGTDGVARVLDFGIAKAASRLQTTGAGQTKGKRYYLAPEQILANEVTVGTDVFAAGVLLWELLTGSHFYGDPARGEPDYSVLERPITAPSRVMPAVAPSLDPVVARALERDPARRYATARELALAIERAITPASSWRTGEWVARVGGDGLARRAGQVAVIESSDAHGTERRLPPSLTRLSVTPPEEPGVGSRVAPPRVQAPASSLVARRRHGTLAMILVATTALVARQVWWSAPTLAARARAVTVTSATEAGNDAGQRSEELAPPSDRGLPERTAEEPPLVARSGSSAPPSAPPGAPARAPSATAAAIRGPTPRPLSPVRRCAPPYSVDSSGIRHLKPECL